MGNVHKVHDLYGRHILSRIPELARVCFVRFLPPSWLAIIDWSTLTEASLNATAGKPEGKQRGHAEWPENKQRSRASQCLARTSVVLAARRPAEKLSLK